MAECFFNKELILFSEVFSKKHSESELKGFALEVSLMNFWFFTLKLSILFFTIEARH